MYVHVDVNNANIVNIEGECVVGLVNALAVKLREILGSVEWLRGWKVEPLAKPTDAGFDLLALLPLPHGGKAALYVECKQEIRPSAFRMVADRTFLRADSAKVVVPVLALPFVSSRIADLCTEYGWGWFDLAGNYRLDVSGLIHLQNAGNKPVDRPPRPSANLSTPEASRVIRALLALENIGRRWTQRDMQDHCQPNVSLGLVNKVVRHLREEAFIVGLPDRGFRLRDPEKLLFAWRDVYRFNQHDRRSYFTLLQGRRLQEALAKFDSSSGGFAAYAAFSAAEFQAPHVRQSKTWLFVSEREISNFEQLVEAKQVDSGDNMVVLIPFDDGVFYFGDGGRDQLRMVCTNLVQTYVDLSHCGGRGEEAAGALIEQRLRPEWRARKMI